MGQEQNFMILLHTTAHTIRDSKYGLGFKLAREYAPPI